MPSSGAFLYLGIPYLKRQSFSNTPIHGTATMSINPRSPKSASLDQLPSASECSGADEDTAVIEKVSEVASKWQFAAEKPSDILPPRFP